MFKSWNGWISSNTGSCLPQPSTNTSVSIMVETIHALWSHTFIYHIAVPAFPNCSCAIIHRIEPTWILALEEQFICNILHTILCKSAHQNGSTQESRLKAIIMVNKVLTKTGYHICFSLAIHNLVLQCKQSWSLHCVQNSCFKSSVRQHKSISDVILRSIYHLVIN